MGSEELDPTAMQEPARRPCVSGKDRARGSPGASAQGALSTVFWNLPQASVLERPVRQERVGWGLWGSAAPTLSTGAKSAALLPLPGRPDNPEQATWMSPQSLGIAREPPACSPLTLDGLAAGQSLHVGCHLGCAQRSEE